MKHCLIAIDADMPNFIFHIYIFTVAFYFSNSPMYKLSNVGPLGVANPNSVLLDV